MKKKVALTAAAVALVGTLAVGGTLAWFTDTEEATNVVTMGEVDIKLSEDGGEDGTIIKGGLTYGDIMPGTEFDKKVSIENLENDAYVRAKITVSGSEAVMNTFLTLSERDNISFSGLDATEGWTLAKDGQSATIIVYYKNDQDNVMKSSDPAWVVFDKVLVPSSWGNEFVNETFNIEVSAEAIQAKNLTEQEAWKEMDAAGVPDLKTAKPDEDAHGTYKATNDEIPTEQ